MQRRRCVALAPRWSLSRLSSARATVGKCTSSCPAKNHSAEAKAEAQRQASGVLGDRVIAPNTCTARSSTRFAAAS